MGEPDIDPFREDLLAMFDTLSHGRIAPTDRQVAMWFRLLAGYPLAAVRAALEAFMREPGTGRTLPVPADVIAKIEAAQAADDRPGPEEAWAIALRGTDEATTIVWTAETAEAWGIAKPVHDAGDEVGARMAFKEAYSRLVADARRQRRPAAWSPSLGHDPRQREAALLEAQQLGRLDAAGAALLGAPAATREQLPLLAAPPADLVASQPTGREAAVAALRSLAESIARRASLDTPDALQKRRTADLAAAAQRRVDAYQGDAP